ncbi:HEXXH motif domain-containing protein [Nocardia heshunensis]
MPVAASEFDEITTDFGSGHGTRRAVAKLERGLLTIRLILLRLLMATVEPDGASVTAVRHLHNAYHELAQLQADHPAVIAEMLCYPHTGTWLERLLDRLAGRGPDAETPLWADCAYLGWLAAAAGIACRPEGHVDVLIRNGSVMLPGLGLAQLDTPDHCGLGHVRWTAAGSIDITWSGGRIQIDSATNESDHHWLPQRWLRGTPSEARVLLDDLDPFRHHRPTALEPRLTAEQARQWQHTFAGAWQLLERDFDRYLTPMRECLRSVAPLSAEPVALATSFTSFSAVGSVYTTAPADACQLALTLIHETQHTKFALLTDQVELFAPDPTPRFYAPWRDDPRPILGLLHGIYAFFGVVDFWRTHRHAACHDSPQAHTDFALWRTQLTEAIHQARTCGLLTEPGRRLLAGLTTTMAEWDEEDVPAAAMRAATEAATAHRTFWTVRNLTPDPDDIAELTARWRSGRQPVRVLAPAIASTTKAALPRHESLSLVAQLTAADPSAYSVAPDQRPPAGDRAYLTGYLVEALALYSRDLRTDPRRPHLWAGLALAMPKIFGPRSAHILRERADIAAAMCEVLGPEAEVFDLVRWLSKIQVDNGIRPN